MAGSVASTVRNDDPASRYNISHTRDPRVLTPPHLFLPSRRQQKIYIMRQCQKAIKEGKTNDTHERMLSYSQQALMEPSFAAHRRNI